MESDIQNFLALETLSQTQVLESLFRLSLAFMLSSLSAVAYQFIQRRERLTISNLPYTMILFSVIVCGMMMAVGNSVARAFGLVGAISILRFRLNIQNPTDMAAILFTMTIGITSGIMSPLTCVIFTLFTLSVFFLLHFYHTFRYRLCRVLLLEVESYFLTNSFLDEMRLKYGAESTVTGTESIGKRTAWKVELLFPASSAIRDWEKWLHTDKRLLFTEGKYQICLDLSEWEPSSPERRK